MKTLAITVTYADRFHLVSEVVNSCFANGVDEILIVDNGSNKHSRAKLNELLEENDNIKVLWNNNNLGSAKAYKQALIKSKELDGQYILLLDDDNKLTDNSLNILKEYWRNEKADSTKVLLAYRPDRQLYKTAIELEDPEYVLSPMNSFYGYHFIKKLNPFNSLSSKSSKPNTTGLITYAPFGGMFFHKSLIDEIGLPREDFFLYSDDHEWSYRVYKKGYGIELLLKSEIEDIDTSWAITQTNIFKTIATAEPKRIYYTIRNRIVFEIKERVTNKFVYNLNINLFLMLTYFYTGGNSKFRLLKKAIKDGFANNLGQKDDDYLNC